MVVVIDFILQNSGGDADHCAALINFMKRPKSHGFWFPPSAKLNQIFCHFPSLCLAKYFITFKADC